MKKLILLVPIFFTLVSAGQESSLTPIQEAQKAIVAKHRKVATEKLIRALRTGKWNSVERSKISENLQSLSEMFFTDQGQRLYETGQSLAYETPDTAMSRFHEALAMEDSNVAILMSIARLQLGHGDCSAANTSLKGAEEVNPYDETLHFLQAKVLLCSHRPADALAILKSEPGDDPVKSVTLAAAMIENGSAHDALTLLQKAANKDSLFPEVHYWIWKISEAHTDSGQEQGMKYVALCKNLNLRTRRKYLNEPRLCAQSQEVEDALKALENNSTES